MLPQHLRDELLLCLAKVEIFNEKLKNVLEKDLDPTLKYFDSLDEGFKLSVEKKRSKFFKQAFESIPEELQEEIFSRWAEDLPDSDLRKVNRIIEIAWGEE